MAGYRTYDPKAHVISFGGLILTGFAENKWLTVKRKSALFTSTAGASGEVARSKMNDPRGEAELTLLASSSDNDALSALVQLDDQTGQAVGVFQVQDLNGTTLIHAANAWISAYPDIDLAKEVGETPWKFATADLDVFRGGLLITG